MSFSPFTITKVESHDLNKLTNNLKNVVMLKDRNSKPYTDATISLLEMDFESIHPAQRYVLADGLLKAQHLSWELKRFGFDPFRLDGYLTIWTDQSSEPIDLLPPILESILEDNGTINNIINDGMHRLFAARLAWIKPKVILVKNLPKKFPYYAYPIPGNSPWDSVQILEGDTIPKGFIKKWHRIADNKLLYRDFNSSFTNVGGPRGQG
jgi:hypothetical protein